MKTKTIVDSVTFKASAHDVYEALMDSEKHAAFTGAPAEISREIGGAFTAFGGGLRGKTIELVPNKKIVQEWQGESPEWPAEHFSTVIFVLEEGEGVTNLNLTHAAVPEAAYESIKQGWSDYYWVKMKEALGG